jgi:hypothetical protein
MRNSFMPRLFSITSALGFIDPGPRTPAPFSRDTGSGERKSTGQRNEYYDMAGTPMKEMNFTIITRKKELTEKWQQDGRSRRARCWRSAASLDFPPRPIAAIGANLSPVRTAHVLG